LGTITGSDFEAVDVTPLMVDPNSGQALQGSVYVTVTPGSATVQVNQQQQFTAAVTGNTNQLVTWDVNGAVGGNGTAGFIDSISGLYTAPAVMPSPATVTVHATSKAVPSAVGSAAVTIANPPPPVSITISPASATLHVGSSRQFKAKVQNTSNTGVIWKVNGVTGGNAKVGTISLTGEYIAPGAVPSPDHVAVTAVSAADPTKSASASVTIHARQ
jgi:hypothetical protein